MRKLLILVVGIFLVACDRSVPIDTAKALVQTGVQDGTVMWSVKDQSSGISIVAVCEKNERESVFSVYGTADKPQTYEMQHDVASCGERHKLWTAYDKAVTSSYDKKKAEEARMALEEAVKRFQ